MKGLVVDLILNLKKRCILEEMEISHQAKLSSSEMSCVLSIEPGESLGCSELSERMGLSPSRGSRVMDGLIASGYLKRETDPDDRRCTRISLTGMGIDGRKAVDLARNRCEQRIRERLAPSDYRTVERGLSMLLEALEG